MEKIEYAKEVFKKYIEDDKQEFDCPKDERHKSMDFMLLDIIGDEELTELFKKVFKYYI